jgi:hypothetical protein
MMTVYVTEEDMRGWTWQKQYRFGVFLIYPPDPPMSAVNALRAKYDPPSHAACDAHVSLPVPLPKAPSATDWSELETLAAGFRSFPIQYGPPRNYLPAAPGVCLTIEPQSAVDALRALLESAGVFRQAPPRPYPFSAHMTIAEFITVDRMKALMVELEGAAPRGSFLCTHVSYAVPDARLHFTERGRLHLQPSEARD